MAQSTTFHLVFAGAAYQRMVPALLTAAGTCSLGQVRRNDHGLVTELLVHQLETAGSLPRGTQYAPWADWALVVSPPHGQSQDPRDWLRRIEPRPGQLVAVVLLGMGEAAAAGMAWWLAATQSSRSPGCTSWGRG